MYKDENQKNFEELLGKTLTKIVVSESKDEIIFVVDDGVKYRAYHNQGYCECVEVEDICGNLEDLIGTPLLLAEKVMSDENPMDIIKEHQDSFTWTFYKMATINGSVTIRWYGESTGYYSESVEFEIMEA